MILEPQDKVTSLTLSCGYRSAFLSVALSPLTWPLTFWILLYLILDKQIAPLKWAVLFCICLKNLNCQTWILVEPWSFYKIGIIDSSNQINTRWYSGKSMHGSCYNLHIFTGLKGFCGTNKKTCNTFTLNNFKLISGAIWLAVFCFWFLLASTPFWENILHQQLINRIFFPNNGVVGIWFFPHFHFFQHGKINKRYITSVNANKEQEPKKV